MRTAGTSRRAEGLAMSDTAPRQRRSSPKLEGLERQIGAMAPIGQARGLLRGRGA